MDHEQLKSLIRRTSPIQRRPSACPQDEALASYMEGGLREPDHAEFERHLADCAWCMDRVGILGRARASEAMEAVPEFTLARARRLAGPHSDPKPAWRRHVPRWAAAAIVVLALSLAMRAPSPEPPAGDPNGLRTQRNIQPLSPVPKLLNPSDDALVDLAHARFEWSPVADSLYYRVRIVSDAGDLLWQERVRETHWNPPPGLQLRTGGDYFVRIDAYLTEAKSVSSDYTAFRVSGRD